MATLFPFKALRVLVEGLFEVKLIPAASPAGGFVTGSYYTSPATEFTHNLLRVSAPCLLTSGRVYNFNVTSCDVIHSFSVPCLGIKIDAVPGKMNTVCSELGSGIFYGQCSEICGVNHTVIPVVLVAHPYFSEHLFKVEIGVEARVCSGCKGLGVVLGRG